jgi:hypothetical protein
MKETLECFGTANMSDCCAQCPDNEECAKETMRRQKLGIKCISLYPDTNEHFQKDETKVYFYFHDYPNKLEYQGTITWKELFNFLKHKLTTKEEEV